MTELLTEQEGIEEDAVRDWTEWVQNETPYSHNEIFVWTGHPVKGLRGKKPEDYDWYEIPILKAYVQKRVEEGKPLIDLEDVTQELLEELSG